MKYEKATALYPAAKLRETSHKTLRSLGETVYGEAPAHSHSNAMLILAKAGYLEISRLECGEGEGKGTALFSIRADKATVARAYSAASRHAAKLKRSMTKAEALKILKSDDKRPRKSHVRSAG
jgi:poly-gamma-glutamate capsule biosynthesis protein CapA/YwtB (metallophosphatase superfamily)